MGKQQLTKILVLSVFLAGCPLDGDKGLAGADGVDGIDGIDGLDGINCWDVNSNMVNDPEEDTNRDGRWDALDCSIKLQSAQNLDVELNHQHICEAFANLGQYPQGCPSDTHTKPAGTLRQIEFLLDSGAGYAVSCDHEPNNGLLSAIPKNGAYSWSLEGGFIASVTTVSALDELENNACFEICNADSECIASWAVYSSDPGATSFECHIFHHSDTVGNWERSCAADLSDCAARAGALEASQRWSTICP